MGASITDGGQWSDQKALVSALSVFTATTSARTYEPLDNSYIRISIVSRQHVRPDTTPRTGLGHPLHATPLLFAHPESLFDASMGAPAAPFRHSHLNRVALLRMFVCTVHTSTWIVTASRTFCIRLRLPPQPGCLGATVTKSLSTPPPTPAPSQLHRRS